LDMPTVGEPAGKSFTIVVKGDGVQVERQVDSDTAAQVFALITGGPVDVPPADRTTGGNPRMRAPSQSTRQRRKPAAGGDAKPKRRRRSAGPGVVKDLTLRPGGKTPFATFATEKKPRTHGEKEAVALYWLQHDGGVTEGVTAAHVNTCYQEAGWARPADLVADLYLTASRKGWIDTSDMENITLTTRGEDIVLHTLPPAAKKDVAASYRWALPPVIAGSPSPRSLRTLEARRTEGPHRVRQRMTASDQGC
jgi:hypothetical protein